MKKGKFRDSYTKTKEILMNLKNKVNALTLTQLDYENLRLQEVKLYTETNNNVPKFYLSSWCNLISELTDTFNMGYALLEQKAQRTNKLQEFNDWWDNLGKKEIKLYYSDEKTTTENTGGNL